MPPYQNLYLTAHSTLGGRFPRARPQLIFAGYHRQKWIFGSCTCRFAFGAERILLFPQEALLCSERRMPTATLATL